MNERTPLTGRSETSGRRPSEGNTETRLARELQRLRAGIWSALDALEYGDTWHAADVLLALVEERGELAA